MPRNIIDLTRGEKNLHCKFIAVEKLDSSPTHDGRQVTLWLVADKTAAIQLCLYDEVGNAVTAGDILRLTGGHCTLHKTSLSLFVGPDGKLEKIGEFTMVFTEKPNLSVRSEK
eukprot:m.13970 g.13970  ORF g.13970 m.13970 type:complete len:113 (-) comp7706_c0_seq1:192-530(-)